MQQLQTVINATELWQHTRRKKTEASRGAMATRPVWIFVLSCGFRASHCFLFVAIGMSCLGTMACWAQESSSIAKQAQNPIANLISVPLENDFDPQTGYKREDSYVLEAKPVVQSLARWVQGLGKEEEVGVLTQQVVGRLFVESYSADSDSWTAARTLAGALQAKGIATFFPSNIAKVRNAKKLLALKVNGDLAGVHATGVALHNLVKGFQRMRLLYGDISQRSKLTPEAVGKECLFAPALVLRQATGSGKQTGCPYDKNTVFLFELESAHAASGAEDIVFLDETWSRCPAAAWVPALLRAVWASASDVSN